MNRFTILLRDVRIDGCIGILPQEKTVSQPFSVSLEVNLPSCLFESSLPDENLEYSISYAELYEILLDEFKTGAGLLETLAVRISKRLQESYPIIDDGVIEIRKLNPPIPGIAGEAGIKYFFKKN